METSFLNENLAGERISPCNVYSNFYAVDAVHGGTIPYTKASFTGPNWPLCLKMMEYQ